MLRPQPDSPSLFHSRECAVFSIDTLHLENSELVAAVDPTEVATPTAHPEAVFSSSPHGWLGSYPSTNSSATLHNRRTGSVTRIGAKTFPQLRPHTAPPTLKRTHCATRHH